MKLFKSAESTLWAMVGLAALLVGVFFVLHLVSGVPVVGGGANFVATHASGSAYGY
jgi:hypothetical protein